MKVHYLCPACETTAGAPVDASTRKVACGHCGRAMAIDEAGLADGRLQKCLVCPSDDLFVRKDFPQRLGLGIIFGGFILSSIAWYFYQVYLAYGILFATALVDAGLYLWMGNVVTCYHCHAEYRDLGEQDGYEPFDLEVHERYRQQAARLAQAEAEAEYAAQQAAAENDPAAQPVSVESNDT